MELKEAVMLLEKDIQDKNIADVEITLRYLKKQYANEAELEELLAKMAEEIYLSAQMLLYGFLIDITGNSKYVLRLIEIARHAELPDEVYYFIYNQLKAYGFWGKYEGDKELNAAQFELLKDCVDGFRSSLTENLSYIPQEQRDKNLVIVITSQFLFGGHAPTKTALGRCVALMKMGKRVLLINTAEHMPRAGDICFWDKRIGNYQERLLDAEYVEWDGYKIPFFQCDNNMPNVETIDYLLTVIRRLRPYIIVQIASESVLASLANDMVPVLSVGTVFSELGNCLTAYQTLGRRLTEEDVQFLEVMGRSVQDVIEHRFTTELVKQERVFTRQEFGLKDSDFVLLLMGMRLNDEVTDELLQMLEEVRRQTEICVMLVGKFARMQEVVDNYPELAKKMYFMGMQTDVMAYIELCDLYVNPRRTGGGMSCVEAMSKGLPVVTMPNCDVAVNAGEDFYTENYETMVQLIIKYKEDENFYKVQSEKARERAVELTDTDAEFGKVIKEFCRREGLEF